MVGVAIVGSAVAGAASSKYASNKAASAAKKQGQAAEAASDAQLTASRENIAYQREALDKTIAANRDALNKQLAVNEPWQKAGLDAVSRLMTRMDSGQFDPKSFEFNQDDPGYQFRLKQMEKAVSRRASVRGRNASPATDKELARHVGDLASQEYQNSFNRYVTERQLNERDRNYKTAVLSDVANLGRGAAASNVGALAGSNTVQSNAFNTSTANIMNQTTAGANAVSQGYLNRADAYGNAAASQSQAVGGIATAANTGMQNYLLYNAFNSGGGLASTAAAGQTPGIMS